jgi:hypothetical protein
MGHSTDHFLKSVSRPVKIETALIKPVFFFNRTTIPTKDNVTFYLPRPLHFLSYQSNKLLRRSDLHRKKIDIRIVLMTFYFLEPKTIIVDLTAKF